VLLPVRCLLRRADAAGVIGQALVLAAAGHGHRVVAERRAGPLRSAFTALACGLDPDPLLPAPAGSDLADAVTAVVAAAARRWGSAASGLSPWELASAVTMGALLAPWMSVALANAGCLW
jgi:NAD(P)-dependent dehydrogenase (short-subunit alcohol dehydrogenase family)